MTGVMEDVKEYMNEHSYFELDDEQDEMIVYSTRQNGNVLEEEPGQEDIVHANLIRNEIHKLGYSTEIEPVDEWIMLTIYK